MSEEEEVTRDASVGSVENAQQEKEVGQEEGGESKVEEGEGGKEGAEEKSPKKKKKGKQHVGIDSVSIDALEKEDAESKEKVTESIAAAKKIFDRLDINHDGLISSDDIKVVMKSLQLFPPAKKIKELIAYVDSNEDGYVELEDFVKMRREKRATELNVLAEFKKYDVSHIHRGFITSDSIRKVLTEEGHDEEFITKKIEEIMSSDSNADGKVSYRDLYERMMERIPDEWLEWIYENVRRGVADSMIVNILIENGFKEDVAHTLLSRTKKEGRLVMERTYADSSHNYVYTVKA